MEQERPEFFNLDEIDRRVLLWLMNNVQPNAIKSWIEFIATDYKRRKTIIIDPIRLYNETQEQ
ncbi:MAG TPA: hypothetical protein VL443_16590 [Cyclobacteriaceae bacterium]|jgi:hypothetical protein|nr:hypothetical protein [Cyclobacteriaceae bacterium]